MGGGGPGQKAARARDENTSERAPTVPQGPGTANRPKAKCQAAHGARHRRETRASSGRQRGGGGGRRRASAGGVPPALDGSAQEAAPPGGAVRGRGHTATGDPAQRTVTRTETARTDTPVGPSDRKGEPAAGAAGWEGEGRGGRPPRRGVGRARSAGKAGAAGRKGGAPRSPAKAHDRGATSPPAPGKEGGAARSRGRGRTGPGGEEVRRVGWQTEETAGRAGGDADRAAPRDSGRSWEGPGGGAAENGSGDGIPARSTGGDEANKTREMTSGATDVPGHRPGGRGTRWLARKGGREGTGPGRGARAGGAGKEQRTRSPRAGAGGRVGERRPRGAAGGAGGREGRSPSAGRRGAAGRASGGAARGAEPKKLRPQARKTALDQADRSHGRGGGARGGPRPTTGRGPGGRGLGGSRSPAREGGGGRRRGPPDGPH